VCESAALVAGADAIEQLKHTHTHTHSHTHTHTQNTRVCFAALIARIAAHEQPRRVQEEGGRGD
jgi:hypothetical protein